MAKKQAYNWKMVKPGDIISFRYKGKTSEREESFRWILWTREINIVQESAVFVVLFSEDRGEKSSTFLLSLEEV